MTGLLVRQTQDVFLPPGNGSFSRWSRIMGICDNQATLRYHKDRQVKALMQTVRLASISEATGALERAGLIRYPRRTAHPRPSRVGGGRLRLLPPYSGLPRAPA